MSWRDGGNEDCKVFVGGIADSLDKEDIEKTFAKFGDITDIRVPRHSGGGVMLHASKNVCNDVAPLWHTSLVGFSSHATPLETVASVGTRSALGMVLPTQCVAFKLVG